MKKLTILLTTILLLTSCGRTAEYTDPYLYFDSNDTVQTACRFNTLTGTVTAICTDPLCSHAAEECPFGGLRQIFSSDDGKLYYSVNVSEKKNDGTYNGVAYRVYDLENGTVKELCRRTELMREGNFTESNSVAGDWQYICRSGTTEAYCRVNWKTGEIEDLSYLSEVLLPVYEDEEHLYAPLTANLHGVSTGILRVNHKFGDREILFDTGEIIGNTDYSALDSGYIYYDHYNDNTRDLYRYDMKNGKTETVVTDVLAWVICSDRIIYTKIADDPAWLYYDAWRERDVYDNVGGKIYACDLSGKKETLIFDDDSIIIRALDMRTKGDCLIFDHGKMVEKEFENGEMRPRLDSVGGGKVVLNVTSGEYRIYEKNW